MVSATESVRPTGESAYVDGHGAFQAAKRIVSGAALRGDSTIAVDACVIGSGAGGAVVAKELAEGGLRVAILEEGDWWETDSFDARPREMMRRLYRDAGQIATLGTPSIVLPLGIGVGGTTIVNSATCFRTPARVLERWRREFGLEQLDPESLEPYFRRVERRAPSSTSGSSSSPRRGRPGRRRTR